jgi:hypothetical protein
MNKHTVIKTSVQGNKFNFSVSIVMMKNMILQHTCQLKSVKVMELGMTFMNSNQLSLINIEMLYKMALLFN